MVGKVVTDRHQAYIVTLDEQRREDDAGDIRTALRQIQGVAGVEKADVDNMELSVLRNRMATSSKRSVRGF